MVYRLWNNFYVLLEILPLLNNLLVNERFCDHSSMHHVLGLKRKEESAIGLGVTVEDKNICLNKLLVISHSEHYCQAQLQLQLQLQSQL